MTTPTSTSSPPQTIDPVGGRLLAWSHYLPTPADTTYIRFNPTKHYSHYLLTQTLPNALPRSLRTAPDAPCKTTGTEQAIEGDRKVLDPLYGFCILDRKIEIRHLLSDVQEQQVSHDGAVRGRILRKIKTDVDLGKLVRDVYAYKGCVQGKGRRGGGWSPSGAAVDRGGGGPGEGVGGGEVGSKRSIGQPEGAEKSKQRKVARGPIPVTGEWTPPPQLPIDDDDFEESITVRHPSKSTLPTLTKTPCKHHLRLGLEALRKLKITEERVIEDDMEDVIVVRNSTSKSGDGAEQRGRRSLVRRILEKEKQVKGKRWTKLVGKREGRGDGETEMQEEEDEEEEGEVIVVKTERKADGCRMN